MRPTIRPAEPSDLTAVAAIYAYSVRTSVATFDVEEPPLAHWQAKLDSTALGDHFLVACDNDQVLGFAYSGPFRSRPAYARTRELSVYLVAGARGKGLGTRLYTELLDLLRQTEVHPVVAVAAQPNPASNALHCRLGFTEGGTAEEAGLKLGAAVRAPDLPLRQA